MDQFVAHKLEVEKKIVEILAKSYEEDIIAYSDFREISDFVLREIPKLANQTDLTSFLRELSWNWNMFEPLLTSEEAPLKQANEKQAAERMANMIEQGNPDQAIDEAKKVIN